jgi:hypothetical protein
MNIRIKALIAPHKYVKVLCQLKKFSHVYAALCFENIYTNDNRYESFCLFHLTVHFKDISISFQLHLPNFC